MQIQPIRHLLLGTIPKRRLPNGYKKCRKRRRSLVDLRRQGAGGYPKNLKFEGTSFMDGPLFHIALSYNLAIVHWKFYPSAHLLTNLIKVLETSAVID